MRKFFCSYNNLTERYEFKNSPSSLLNPKANIQAENNLKENIKTNLQRLYEEIILLKENEKDTDRLIILDETELLISNLYYSLFISPLEIGEKREINGKELKIALELAFLLERDINIPEYNRLIVLIKNNLNRLL